MQALRNPHRQPMPTVSLPLPSLFTGEHHAQDAAAASVRQDMNAFFASLAKVAKRRSMQESQGQGGDGRSYAELVDTCRQCGHPTRQTQRCAARTSEKPRSKGNLISSS